MEFEVGKLIESIGISVSEAQQGLENHALQRFFHYFETAPEKDTCQRPTCGQMRGKDLLTEEQGVPVMEPTVAKILLPCDDDLSKRKVAEIPLVTLANHMQVRLDKVTVRVKTNFLTDSAGGVRMDINGPIPKSRDACENPEGDGVESGMVEMVFQVAKMPEGTSRVVQNIERVV